MAERKHYSDFIKEKDKMISQKMMEAEGLVKRLREEKEVRE